MDGDYIHTGDVQNYVCSTASELNPYFTVDLGAVYHTSSVAAFNMELGCCAFLRMDGSEFRIGNSTIPTENPVCGSVFGEAGF